MIPKQDRIKPRTVEDLERMYNFKEQRASADVSKRYVAAALEAASSAKRSAAEAVAGLESKVGKTDDSQVIDMINRAHETAPDNPIQLVFGRVGSWNIGLAEAIAPYFGGAILFSDAYQNANGEEETVYLTPQGVYVGTESAMETASWADIIRVVNAAK